MDLEALARHIARDRQTLAPFTDFPISGIDTAYDVQDLVAREAPPPGGFKIAWNAPALLERYHVTEPAVARVAAGEIVQSGVTLDPKRYATPMLEPEIAAVLATDLPPRAGGWTGEAVLPYIERFVPAFEVLDRREGNSVHAPSIIAAGVFNAGAVLGSGDAEGPTVNLHGEVVFEIDGVVKLHAHDTAPQPPAEAVAYVVTHLQRRGTSLRKGQVILCGSHAGLVPIAPGQHARFAVEGLGEVTLEFG